MLAWHDPSPARVIFCGDAITNEAINFSMIGSSAVQWWWGDVAPHGNWTALKPAMVWNGKNMTSRIFLVFMPTLLGAVCPFGSA